MARIKCSNCFKWDYNFKTGERETFLGAHGAQVPVERPACVPPPCGRCPKRGPQYEADYKLSTKNMQTLILYRNVQATHGACLSDAERSDELLVHNLTLVDSVVRKVERIQAAEGLA